MAVKSKEQINQRNASTDKGFGGVNPHPKPTQPDSGPQSPGAGSAGSAGGGEQEETTAMQLHASVRAGIANTSTAHIQGLANLLKEAEDFQVRAGQQLGRKALRVSQGEPMLQSFVQTLNAGLEVYGAPRVSSLPDVGRFIDSLSLDAPVPEIQPRFYLEPVVEQA